MRISAEQSCLMVIDVQENLAPVTTDPRKVIRNCALLLRAARRLAVPALVTEQYPRGLGATMFDLREWMPPEGAFAKLTFSCAEDAAIMAHLAAAGRRQVVVAGMEAHVCVLQTALGLKEQGYDVFVVADACASRRIESETLAWWRLQQAGVVLVSLEMVYFEWLKVAGSPEFKELVALIK